MVLPAGAVLSAPATTAAASSGSGATPLLSVGGSSATVPGAGPVAPSGPTALSPAVLASLQNAPTVAGALRAPNSWLSNLVRGNGPARSTPLASYPNLNLLEHPATDVANAINPGYVGQPAPMGIANYGLGTSPYTYSPANFLGSVTLQSPANVTDPGAQSVINPGGGNLGNVGSVYEYGIQLNTVLTNVSIPGTNDGVFWTQNVLNVNDTGIHFVQDIFNFSLNGSFFIPSDRSTILSGCGTSDLSTMLSVYGGVYQCVGPTVPISPAEYPITIDLYNNASITASNETQLTFGVEIMTAVGPLASGAIDTVLFNNPNASVAPPPNPVGFTVSGTTPSPVGLLQDSELDLVGSIGGNNAVFRTLNASLALEYSNSTAGPFVSVPSAYNFGSDTGETSTGVAGYWSGTTEYVNQGPSFLYGLWGAVPHASVPSGSIRFAGTVVPSNGFVFVSNVAPDAIGSNFTWVPTDSVGAFDSLLPPSIPPATQYYVQAFAPGYEELNATPFNAASLAPYGTISLNASLGTLNAPIYIQGNAQASAVALAVTGSALPIRFQNLTVSMNYTFNHLNDYGFPSFVAFSAEGVTLPILVSNLSQGRDTANGTYYIWDAGCHGSTGLVSPSACLLAFSLDNYSDQIQLFGSTAVSVSNETFVGSQALGSFQGGSVFLWGDTNAVVRTIDVGAGPYGADYAGVFVGDSTGTTVSSVAVSGGSNGVVDVGSTSSTIEWVNATGTGTFGIYALSSAQGTYTELSATGAGSTAVYAGGDYGGGYYYQIPGIDATTVTHVNATGWNATVQNIGAELFYSDGDSLSELSSANYAAALVTVVSNGTNANGLLLDQPVGYYGAILEGDLGGGVSSVTVTGPGTGVLFYADEGVTGSGGSSPSGANTYDVLSSADTQLSDTEYVTAQGVSTVGGVGLYLRNVNSASVTGATATSAGIAVEVYGSQLVSVSQVSATDGSLGVFGTAYVYRLTVSQVTADNGSLGVLLRDYSDLSSVSSVTATNGSMGVAVEQSTFVTVNNVTASNPTRDYALGGIPVNPYLVLGFQPAAAVYSYANAVVSFSGITTTNVSVGLFDSYSGQCQTSSGGLCVAYYAPAPGGITVDNLQTLNATMAV